MMKRIGPSIEPCGTPKNNIQKVTETGSYLCFLFTISEIG